jgi:hypothetical protein
LSNRPEPTSENKTKSSPGITRWIIIGVGILAGLVIIAFIIAVIGGISGSEGVAAAFRIMRDFFIIVLALQGILICVALVVLILQVSALINVLRNEIKPIVDETRETMTTIRGTTQFISQNVTEPVIRVSAAVAGARALFSELAGIRRNMNGDQSRTNHK